MAFPLSVLALCGSLRTASLNRALIRAAQAVAPEGLVIREFERMREIPPYDEDVQKAGDPDSVVALKREIAAADALLFVTPEYNYSVPGALKNAIDWASRPAATSPLTGKPAGIMGASTGMSGTIRSQLHLRQILLGTQCLVMHAPEVLIPKAADRFDATPALTDESTRELVRKFVVALGEWTRRAGAKS